MQGEKHPSHEVLRAIFKKNNFNQIHAVLNVLTGEKLKLFNELDRFFKVNLCPDKPYEFINIF